MTEQISRIFSNGYAAIPIPARSKAPRIKGWQKRDFEVCDFQEGANIGIRTGDDIMFSAAFFDIDVLDALAVETIVAAWKERFGDRGPLLRRTGLAPKTGILFGFTEAGQKKRQTRLGAIGQIEVLANGQQFVAFGIHPDTGQPYHWHNGPSPEDTQALSLPRISPGEIDAFTAEHLSAAQATPWGLAAMEGEMAAVQTAAIGNRNTQLNTSAFRLGQAVAGGQLDEALAVSALETTADFAGLGSDEAKNTIQSGLVTGLSFPRKPETKADATPDFADDPVDLWGRFEPPELPQGLLPPLIELFARETGVQMGADPAGLALAALVTCAAAIPDRVKIKVKRHDSWTESPRLWGVLVGPPSTKKSPILAAATAPLCALDGELFRDWQEKTGKYWALPKEERVGPPPPQTRHRIEDTTVEAAQEVLAGSPWGVLALQDELSGFFGAMDRYNSKGAPGDRAFWLRAFNGGEFALNRVGRGAQVIPNLSISLLGGIQPEPIREFAAKSADDGLLQRMFAIVLKPATVGQDLPGSDVQSHYGALVERLTKLRVPDKFSQPLRFDDDAQRIRVEVEQKTIDLQALEEINRKLASHIGKYDGLFARLCLLFHCIEHAFEDEMPPEIAGSAAERVRNFFDGFLLPHALAFYCGVLGLSDQHDRLASTAGFVLAHKLERVTNRDIQRGDRTMRNLTEPETRRIFEQLEALGWLSRTEGPRPSSPPHWLVNPAVHLRFAEQAAQEASRRCGVRSLVASQIVV